MAEINFVNLTLQPADNHTIALPQMPLYITVVVSVFSGLIFLLGMLGNGSVMYIILVDKDMRDATTWCLFNLCVADTFILLFCLPSALLEFYGKDVWYLGPTICKLMPFLELTAAHASALTVAAISVERYSAICCQVILTSLATGKVIASLWLVAMATTFPLVTLTFHRAARFYDGSTVHVCQTITRESRHRAYVLSLTVAFFVGPLFLIMVLYTLIYQQLVRQARRSTRLSLSQLRRRHVFWMLLLVTGLFFVCLLPFKVVSVWHMYASELQLERLGLESYYNLMQFARTMYYLNSAVNPLLYNIFSTRFRERFRSILACDYVAKLYAARCSGRFSHSLVKLSSSRCRNIAPDGPYSFIHSEI